MSRPVAIPPGEQLIDVATAAAMVGRCKHTTVRHLDAGGVPARWLAGKRLYLRADVQAFIAALPSTGPAPRPNQFQKGSNVHPSKRGAK